LWWAFDGYTGNELPDGQIARRALKVLQDLKTGQTQGDTRPFFLAVGFHKPHAPFFMPKKFYDLYPPSDQISLPANPDIPVDMPHIAWSAFPSVRQYDNTKDLFRGFRCTADPQQALSDDCNFADDIKREIRKSYYACVSFIDSLVGQVLAELENQGFANNTVIVLTSDHGFHLGEHKEWEKSTNFEDATRVPLLIHVPNMTINGTRTHALVELIDLFPTLTELVELPVPPTCHSNSKSPLACVEGTSFASLIANPDQTWKNATFSQFPRPLTGLSVIPKKGTLDKSKGQEQVMGYSIRTAQYRYTEWIKFDHITATPDWNDLWGVELYDHRTETGLFNNENRNYADNASFSALRSQLSTALRAGWRASIPITKQVETSVSSPSSSVSPSGAGTLTITKTTRQTTERPSSVSPSGASTSIITKTTRQTTERSSQSLQLMPSIFTILLCYTLLFLPFMCS
jgi:arylsulfatase A-like enzyme